MLLIHPNVNIVSHFLYLPYLCPCLDLGLFITYLCDLFFIFIFSFIMINHIILWMQTNLFFSLCFKIFPIVSGSWRGWGMWLISEFQKFSLRVLLSICLFFCQFQSGKCVSIYVGISITPLYPILNNLNWTIFLVS